MLFGRSSASVAVSFPVTRSTLSAGSDGIGENVLERDNLSGGYVKLRTMADWTSLRSALAAVGTSVTFTWTELDALVGGLPRSAHVHNAFWKGARGGWPGFTTTNVRVGESVTFVRSGSPTPTAQPAAPKTARPESQSAAANILVGCVKTKLTTAAPAKDLYVSALFGKERAYAEQAGVRWFILSAQHGLVSPEEVLEPYELRLSNSSREYRREWGQKVVNQLAHASGPIEDLTIEVHAGSAYTDAIRDLLRAAGAEVVEPLAGLSFGPRLAWYGDRPAAPAAPTPPPEVEELIQQLTDKPEAISPRTSSPPATRGSGHPGFTAGGWMLGAPPTWPPVSDIRSMRDSSTPGSPAPPDPGAEGQRTPCGDGSNRCTSVVATSSRPSA